MLSESVVDSSIISNLPTENIMAKRISLPEFSAGIVAHYGRNVMSRREIIDYAAMNGVGRPAGWDADSPKRNQFRFDAVSSARTNRIKIDYNELGVDNNTTEIFEDLEMLTQVVANRNINSLIVNGSAGVGKTHTVLDTLNRKGLVKDRDYVVLKSKTSPLGLYMTLFLNHDKVIVLDDMDDALKNEDCSSILKAALDSYDVREISWSSKKMVNTVGVDRKTAQSIEQEARQALLNGETDVALPNRFVFRGQVIFISNMPAEKFDSAVKSRSVCIDLTLTDKQIFSRMKSVVSNLKNASVAKLALTGIIDKYNKGQVNAPNIRTVINYANVLSSGVKNADRLSKYC